MQSDDDFQPFFSLIASTIERSQVGKELETRDIQSSSDQSSSEKEDLESSLTSKSSAVYTKGSMSNEDGSDENEFEPEPASLTLPEQPVKQKRAVVTTLNLREFYRI